MTRQGYQPREIPHDSSAELTGFTFSFLAVLVCWSTVGALVANPFFLYGGIGLLIAGYGLSFLFRCRFSSWLMMLRLIITGLILCENPCYPLFPIPSCLKGLIDMEDRALVVVILLCWFNLALAFSLGSRDRSRSFSLTLPLLSSLSVFGVLASINPGTGSMVAFIVFLVLAASLLSYESYLNHFLPRGIRYVSFKEFAPKQIALLGALLMAVVPLTSPVNSLLEMSTSASSHWITQMREIWQSQEGHERFADFGHTIEIRGGYYGLGKQVLFKMKSKEPHRLRGQVYDLFSDNVWLVSRDLSDAKQLTKDKNGWFHVGSSFPQEKETNVTVLEPQVNVPGMIYHSGKVLEVRGMMKELWQSGDVLSLGDTMLKAGETYTVKSLEDEPTITALRSASGGLPPGGVGYYLQVPPTSAPIADLADQIAGDEETPYRKAEALGFYLASHCRYSLSIPEVPKDTDAVMMFLFKTRSGACDLYASALTLMCRALGIPARFVAGFAQGTWDTESGTYQIRQADAHTWTEIYLPEFGWVALDPTAGSVINHEEQSTVVPSTSHQRTDHIRTKWWVGWAMGCLVVLIVGIVGVSVSRDRRPRSCLESLDPKASVLESYLLMCEYLQRKGLPRERHQTPMEYLDSIQLKMPPRIAKIVTEMTTLASDAAFSPRVLGSGDANRACAQLNRLREIWKESVRDPSWTTDQ